ncbi:MAG TPA: TIGR03086 family metal-binding protein [Jatrophihabitans sp.]|nr:TIGR03086 family metal-binding protein [Jatrophihabitans sp.]
MLTDLELLGLHRHAAETCAAVANQVHGAHLTLATPCAAWTVRDLLAHMIGNNIGFAAAALGNTEAGAFADVQLSTDPAAQFAASTRALLTAFNALDLERDEIYLAVVRGGSSWPARTAIGFHLVDSVVHGWDLAVSIGESVSFDASVEQEAWSVARNVPDDESRRRPDAVFQPGVTTSATSLLERTLAALGRDPAWTPPSS